MAHKKGEGSVKNGRDSKKEWATANLNEYKWICEYAANDFRWTIPNIISILPLVVRYKDWKKTVA